MRCYLFTDHRVTVCSDAPNEIAAESVLVGRASELDPKRFPVVRLLAIYNALPGVNPTKRFADRKIAIKSVWSQLQALPLGEVKTESKQALIIRLLRQPAGSDSCLQSHVLYEFPGFQSIRRSEINRESKVPVTRKNREISGPYQGNNSSQKYCVLLNVSEVRAPAPAQQSTRVTPLCAKSY